MNKAIVIFTLVIVALFGIVIVKTMEAQKEYEAACTKLGGLPNTIYSHDNSCSFAPAGSSPK